MNSSKIKFSVFGAAFIFINAALCQIDNSDVNDAIGFMLNSEDVENNQKGLIYMPAKCSGNQLLFPIDGGKDWICDCAPGFVYYPKTETCYPPFKQGPCADGEIIAMPRKVTNRVPFCRTNKCKDQNQVRYRKLCWEIGKPGGPCGPTQVLRINSATFRLRCAEDKSLNVTNYAL